MIGTKGYSQKQLRGNPKKQISIKDYNLWGYHLFFEFLHTQQKC